MRAAQESDKEQYASSISAVPPGLNRGSHQGERFLSRVAWIPQAARMIASAGLHLDAARRDCS